jgi:Cft2 family RNA processing exonuclease
MPLTVEWDGGVSVEYCGTKLIFDPGRKNRCSEIFITHAHSDHSKGFSFRNCSKFSTGETREIVEAYGKEIKDWKRLRIRDEFKIGDLEVVCHNAGHVLGSVLYEAITQECNVVYTGDLQFKDSFTLKGARPVPCDILIIECTFGSESFRFPERDTLAQEMVKWALRTIKSGKIPTFKADSLGNAQEITKAFNMYSDLPVVVHWRVAQINEVYRSNGQGLEFLDSRLEEAGDVTSSGECILITPKNVNLADHLELEPALVSGWALWSKKNAFPLSDHADFNQLIEFIDTCKPKTVLTCHGGRFNHTFAKQVEKRLGIQARPLDLIPTKFVSEH